MTWNWMRKRILFSIIWLTGGCMVGYLVFVFFYNTCLQCNDKNCRKDLQAYLDRMKLCCHQIRITGAVKADLNTSIKETVGESRWGNSFLVHHKRFSYYSCMLCSELDLFLAYHTWVGGWSQQPHHGLQEPDDGNRSGGEDLLCGLQGGEPFTLLAVCTFAVRTFASGNTFSFGTGFVCSANLFLFLFCFFLPKTFCRLPGEVERFQWVHSLSVL